MAKRRGNPQTVAAETDYNEAMEYLSTHGDLQDKFLLLQEMCGGEKSSTIRVFHEMGDVIRGIDGNVKKYGSKAVKMLSVVLNITPRTLQTYGLFRDKYDTQMVDEILSLRDTTGNFPLSFQHIRETLTKDISTTKGLEYLRKAATNGWTAQKLSKHIKEDLRDGKSLRDGRKANTPDTADALLYHMESALEDFLRKDASVWELPKNPAIAVLWDNLSDVTPVTLTHYRTVMALLEEHQRASKRLLEMLSPLEAIYEHQVKINANLPTELDESILSDIIYDPVQGGEGAVTGA